MTYLSVGAIFRDEAEYLQEWIEFHRLVGVERFFLYDNGSVDDWRTVLAPYMRDGIVEVHDWPHGPAVRRVQRLPPRGTGPQSRWIAFIDVDEFLFSPTRTPLPEMLTRYERWPGVGVHWCVYGGSGHLQKPDGLVIESYLHHTTEPLRNRWIKSIVDPARTLSCFTSHAFRYRADGARAYAVDEHHRELSDKAASWPAGVEQRLVARHLPRSAAHQPLLDQVARGMGSQGRAAGRDARRRQILREHRVGGDAADTQSAARRLDHRSTRPRCVGALAAKGSACAT